MSRDLPARPSLEHLRKQAKDLVHSGAAARLADAQLMVAREYGFPSWTKLKLHVESLSGDPVETFVSAVKANDVEKAARALRAHPELRARLDDALPGFSFDGTALLAAAGLRSRPMIDLLLDAGADIDQKSHWWAGGFGVLDSADPALVLYLLERGATMTINAAARLGRLDEVERLVREDPAAVHARGGDGQTPLHVASTVDVARFLIDNGADVDALDVDHESTPAQYLVREHPDVARFLVERGCRSDILMASALGDLPLVEQFVQRDPTSVETEVSARYFPMRNPRAGGSIYIWTLGANKTPHQLAREFGHEDVFQFLMKHTNDALQLATACELGDRALVDEILARRPDIADALSEHERGRLAAAAENNNLGAVRLMLGAGWPTNVPGRMGATALHWAAHNGNAEMARELLRAGAATDVEESTYRAAPLGWAFHGSRFGSRSPWADYAGVVAALLDAGASLPPVSDIDASESVLELLRRRKIKV